MSYDHFLFDINIKDFKIFPLDEQFIDFNKCPTSSKIHRETVEDQIIYEESLCIPHKSLNGYYRKTMEINSGNEKYIIILQCLHFSSSHSDGYFEETQEGAGNGGGYTGTWTL